jgi:hypothetical protein
MLKVIELYIGLDVHKNSVVVAIARADGSEPEHYGKWGGWASFPEKIPVERNAGRGQLPSAATVTPAGC